MALPPPTRIPRPGPSSAAILPRPGGLRFIRGNPMMEGFQAQEQRNAQADERARIDDQRRRQTQLAGLQADAASARAAGQDPFWRENHQAKLAAAGFGGEALASMDQHQDREEQAYKQVFELAAQGNAAGAKALAQRAGLEWSPDLDKAVSDRRAATIFKEIADFGASHATQWAQAYGAARVGGASPWDAAAQAGPVPPKPTTRAPSALRNVEMLDAEGQPVLGTFDPNTGQYTPSDQRAPTRPSAARDPSLVLSDAQRAARARAESMATEADPNRMTGAREEVFNAQEYQRIYPQILAEEMRLRGLDPSMTQHAPAAPPPHTPSATRPPAGQTPQNREQAALAIRARLQAGEITREQAMQQLREMGY
ncbi:hypothetical protein F1188_10990 [Roseospira marina]|uniref:Uncharacterized protein n=1 Tax=Roseospira marina TaxID=140057 RepID=A0A5M6IAV4_9PROT|nr:hypothetical protein [Roseospira marina]KAA5605420.1 hypothetical protein F1188_10990 [Roseospira marina]MBB4314586.1 hypothetical protein [Roseospira marina]MBB5088852.1 hypothetical protein [Roseospira marina]